MGGMTLPDFTALCPVCHCGTEDTCPDCGGFQLTPRTAAALWARCQLLGDGAYNDIETHGDNPVDPDEAWIVFSDFPRITWRQTSAWRRQCARAFDDLAGDLAAGHWPLPTCPAEEMALHLAVQANQELDDEWLEQILTTMRSDPGDEDRDGVTDALFQDTDILGLFDPALDGIEDPNSDANAYFQIGDYRPPAWFHTFRNMKPRDEQRGLRR